MSRMQIIRPYTRWIRSFGNTNGLEGIPSVARQLGLKVAANAWISSNLAQNNTEVNNLIAAANAGLIDIAIVGSEALLRNDVSDSQLISYMNQVRQAIPSTVPVTTADTYSTLLAHQNVISASDLIFANFYPYWEGVSINNALSSLSQQYQLLVAAAGGKDVIISETGWPSDGNAVGAAIPSPSNAAQFFIQFVTWATTNNVSYFYFEAFDENWKAAYEGPQGAHWGIWDANGTLKPGMGVVFNGQTGDLTLPSVTITMPTSSSTYSTSSSTINLEGTATDSGGVTQITWTNSAGGSGSASFTPGTAVNWTINGIGLAVGQNVLTVTARDAANNPGTDSITVSYTLLLTPPDQPVLSSPSNGAANQATSLSLGWNAAARATSYDVYFGPASPPPLYQSDVSGTSQAVSGLSYSTTYYWRVVAKNSAGSSPASSIWSFTAWVTASSTATLVATPNPSTLAS